MARNSKAIINALITVSDWGLMSLYKMSDLDVFDIFDIEAQSLADEQFAEPLVNSKYVIELTLNMPYHIPFFKKKTIDQKKHYLIILFLNLCCEYNSKCYKYVIEYCVSGEPHLHAFMETELSSKLWTYGITEILRMFAKSIFMKLPKSMYKQFASAEILHHIQRFRCPAMCINLKDNFDDGWKNYIEKTQECV